MSSDVAAPLASSRWRRLMPLAFITYSFAYIDRSNYSLGAAGGLQHALHITSGETGLLGGLFFLGYFVFQVPAASFAERRSVKTLMFWSLIFRSSIGAAQRPSQDALVIECLIHDRIPTRTDTQSRRRPR